MTERRNLITSKQLMALIIGGQLGVGVISTPYELAKIVGHDGWIPTLIAGILTIIASIILVLLLKRYKDKSIYEINKLLFGSFIGMIINFVFILYLLYQTAYSLRIFTETIHGIVLKLTPPIVLTFLILIPTIYFAWYGFKSICRFSGTIFIIMAAVCLLYIVRLQYVRAVFLMPVGQTLGTPAMAGGVIAAIFEYYSFELTAVVYPDIADKKNTMRFVITATIVSMVFYLLTAVILTGFFGERMLEHEVFPLYGLARSYKAPLFERIDLYFMVIWFPAIGITLTAYFIAAYYSITKLFNIRKTTVLIIIYTICLVALSQIPKDLPSLYNFERILNISGIAVAYIYPVICYILSFINKKGVVHS